jgi:hypothetical protein
MKVSIQTILISSLFLSSFLKAEPRLDEVARSAGVFFQSLPECSLFYTLVLEVPNTQNNGRTLDRVETKRHFYSNGTSWRQEIFDKHGNLSRLICYDGKYFYELSIKGEQLNISSDLAKLPSQFSTEISFCPLYYCHALFFCPKNYEFSPAYLNAPTEWQKALAKWDEVKVQNNGEQLQLKNTTYELNWGMDSNAVFPSTLLVKNPSFNNAVCKTEISVGAISSSFADGGFRLPVQIKSTTMVEGGRKIAGMNMQLDVGKSSVSRKSSKTSNESAFTIPISAAKLVWDADVGAYIKK